MQELTTETASPADWDGPWKDAITALLRHFLAMFYPAVHGEIDWSRGFEALDKELQKIAPASETGRRTVDLLFKVWLLTGEERWVLLHVEVQAQRDPGLPERVFVYNYRIKDYYGVPSASFVILADDERTWRPGPYRYNLWNCGGEFRYPTVKLLDFANQVDELEKNTNPFAVVVLAHLKARETADDRSRRRVWKVRLLKGLYNRGWERKDVRELMKLIDWFLTLPREDERLVYEEVEADRKEKKMPYIPSYERIAIEDAEARGKALGEALGKALGEAEGHARGFQESVALVLKGKFGEAATALISDLCRINDVERLKKALDSIQTATSLEDVRRACFS